MNKTLFVILATIGAGLLISSDAQAWGAAHVGYTHVGPGGVQHWGRTAAAGPYGARVGGTTYGGGVYGGYRAGGAYTGRDFVGGAAQPYYPYVASPYYGYSYSGFGMAGPTGGFAAGYHGQ